MPSEVGSRPLLLSLSVGLAVLIAACSTHTERGSGASGSLSQSTFDSDDLRARHPRQVSSRFGRDSARPLETVYYGEPKSGRGSTGAPLTQSSSGEFNLNFENAGIAQVVQSVLGDALGIPYTMSSEVTGTVTISSARALSREELLVALERALQMNNAALVKGGGSYSVVPQNAATAGRGDSGAVPGYGISILPLRYVSTETVMRLVDGFGTRSGSVKVDKARNLLVIVGSSSDRMAAIETAMSFDVDWMQDQAVGVFPLQQARAEAVIPELERIFKAEDEGIGADLVQFMRMSRLNGVLVVAKNKELISRAKSWINRLDSSDPALDSKVHVYRAKYRDAQKLANLLNQIFVSGETEETDVTVSEAPSTVQPATLDRSDRFPANDTITKAFDKFPTQQAPAVVSASVDRRASSGHLRIRADTSDNSVLIYASYEKQREIIAALQQIDVPQLQVAINVTMAEIRLNDELRYGVQYFLKSRSAGLGRNKGSIGLFNTLADNIGRELPGFNFILGGEQSPDVVIDAFDEITDVQVLSSPSLVVMDNEVARFQVGDQIPIVTRTVTSVQDAEAPVSNEVEYRDTGVILKVRPRVSESGVVTMDIEQEISAVSGGSATLTPTISNRLVSSSIAVVDGQTVLLGGLISEQSQGEKSGIPGLHRLKGIGGLFGRKGRLNGRTEVIILIKPSVIGESQDAQRVAEDLKKRMWALGSTQAR